MKKQFLYNIILVGALGFSIQNAYAAAAAAAAGALAVAGTSADPLAMEHAERFSALRTQVYAYHPDFNCDTRAAAPEAKAAHFTELALQLLSLDKAILPRSLELIDDYKGYVHLSFEQQVAVFRKMESCFAAADPAFWGNSFYLTSWINGMDDVATTPAELAIVNTHKQRLGNLACLAEETGAAVNKFFQLYLTSATGGNEESVVRLEGLLEPSSVLLPAQRKDQETEILFCFSGRALSQGDFSKAFEYLRRTRICAITPIEKKDLANNIRIRLEALGESISEERFQELISAVYKNEVKSYFEEEMRKDMKSLEESKKKTQDTKVFRQRKLLVALMQKMPEETEILINELYESTLDARLLLELYKEYKKAIVARDMNPKTDIFLGNMRIKLQEALIDTDDLGVLDMFSEELKSLGDNEFAADLYAARYMRTSTCGHNLEQRRNLINKLEATGDIGMRLAPVLQVIHEHSGGDYYDPINAYHALRKGVEKENFIALYGLQRVPLLHTNYSDYHGVHLKDICRGYREICKEGYYRGHYIYEKEYVPGASKDIKRELARLAFWNEGDVDQIALESRMLNFDGTMQESFTLNETYVEMALKNSLARTIKATLNAIKEDPEQLAAWKIEVNRVLMYSGDRIPFWLKGLDEEIGLSDTASVSAGAGGAARGGAGASAS